MFQQVIPRSFLWLFSIWAGLTIGIIGCGGDDEDNEWGGRWAIATVDGESLEQDFADDFGDAEIDFEITPNEWTFNNDGTMEIEFGLKFESKEQGLEISGEGSMKITGTYSLSGDSYTLTPIHAEGTGLFEDLLEGEVPAVGPTDEETGTWSRSGNTLTLNSDDGSVLVFKKK